MWCAILLTKMSMVTPAGHEKLKARRKTNDHYNLIQKLLESNIQIVLGPRRANDQSEPCRIRTSPVWPQRKVDLKQRERYTYRQRDAFYLRVVCSVSICKEEHGRST